MKFQSAKYFVKDNGPEWNYRKEKITSSDSGKWTILFTYIIKDTQNVIKEMRGGERNRMSDNNHNYKVHIYIFFYIQTS